MGLRKLWLSIGIAVLATLPALYFHYTGIRPDPLLDSALFGVAILAAGRSGDSSIWSGGCGRNRPRTPR